jgi:DNA-directed RNA polymerase specialized sigma24 family protein
MEAKEFLRRFRKYEALIRNKTIELYQCKEAATSITSILGGDRVQGSHNPHRMADAIARYIDIEKEIKEHIDAMISAKKEIIEVIESLNADQYDVLHKLYVQQLTFKEIAYERKKSESWATTVHGRALKAVQKILDEREVKKT